MLSLALAETVTVPEIAAPLAGAVNVTLGGTASTLDTVTETPAEVVTLPAASRARALRTCAPLTAVAVSQGTAKGAAASSAPRATSSSRNWTPATPTLSEAAADTVTVPATVDPAAGAVTDTLGGVVSGAARVVSVKKLLAGATKENDPLFTTTLATGKKLLPVSVL